LDEEVAFIEFAKLCDSLEATSKKSEKKRLINTFLNNLNETEIRSTVFYLIGRPFPENDVRTLAIGHRTLAEILNGDKQTRLNSTPLSIQNVSTMFNQIALSKGKNSRNRKKQILQMLFNRADPLEVKYLIRLILGEMRIGVKEGTILEAVAEENGINYDLMRRAFMLRGDLGEVVEVALKTGATALEAIELCLFTPIKPMLADTSYDLEEILSSHGGRTAFEYKFDGARIQIHKSYDSIKIFSRRLTDVTLSVPDLVERAEKSIHAEKYLVEGEAIAWGNRNRPLPFQDLMRRFRRVHKVESMIELIPLRLYLFDILYLEDRMLIDMNYEERWTHLTKICEKKILTPRIITENIQIADKFLKSSLAAGHEGLMAKALSSRYTPGVRGKQWFKIKPYHSLDAVIVAADWGSGRRTKWLSNYHLAVKDETHGTYLMIGKTFKGLSDEEFDWMTKQLQNIVIAKNDYTIFVEPKIVVEVAYNEIQRSPHYESGFALRFARITRIRMDKGPEDVDSIEQIKKSYEYQFEFKAKLVKNFKKNREF
jgi:DNA ligase-1